MNFAFYKAVSFYAFQWLSIVYWQKVCIYVCMNCFHGWAWQLTFRAQSIYSDLFSCYINSDFFSLNYSVSLIFDIKLLLFIMDDENSSDFYSEIDSDTETRKITLTKNQKINWNMECTFSALIYDTSIIFHADASYSKMPRVPEKTVWEILEWSYTRITDCRMA